MCNDRGVLLYPWTFVIDLVDNAKLALEVVVSEMFTIRFLWILINTCIHGKILNTQITSFTGSTGVNVIAAGT